MMTYCRLIHSFDTTKTMTFLYLELTFPCLVYSSSTGYVWDANTLNNLSTQNLIHGDFCQPRDDVVERRQGFPIVRIKLKAGFVCSEDPQNLTRNDLGLL